ncbi:folate-binding protein [Mangrovimicrobium sediminis]|uniref:Folate-binding protein n=1 Tax=Mangrovimicrobium sediminis TaxID=2562682 RepID=A0A4Z0M4N8_9GAMM|nr:folate-binding protein YgfZ [Haliea sp. SAOS-164]TGD74653.1 folate-binding protein [Haliea sp. SAOS-164]
MNGYFSALPGEGLLHIAGPDTLTFLQGQTTCDTRKLSATQALPGAYCTAQGRMVCDFLLVQLDAEHVALRMRRDILDTAAATLGKFIVFSKAKIDIARDDWRAFGCWGEDAPGVLSDVVGSEPGSEDYAAASAPGIVAVRAPGAEIAFEVFIDTQNHAELVATLRERLQAGDESQWRALQMRAGVARVEAATSGEFIPQLFNYDLTGHVSFNKGCYTGQEIVARLHYRGKPKQRAYLAEVATGETPAPGSKLYTDGLGASTGEIVNSVQVDGKALCLAVATGPGVAGGLLLGEGGPAMTLLQLPYALPE